MSAGLGTWGETQVTSILSDSTWPKPRSVGAGTAIAKREQLGSGFIRVLVVDLQVLLVEVKWWTDNCNKSIKCGGIREWNIEKRMT